MAVPTLTWEMTDFDVFTETSPDWVSGVTDLYSIGASDKQSVNFLAHIARHIADNSTYLTVINSAFGDTDGTLILEFKQAASRIRGVYFILGVTTEALADGNSVGNFNTFAHGTAKGNTYGIPPHNINDANNTKHFIAMNMVIGIDPTTADFAGIDQYSWRSIDWWDDNLYDGATTGLGTHARASGSVLTCGDLGNLNAGGYSHRFGFSLIESSESFTFCITNKDNDISWLSGGGAFVDPTQVDPEYGELPGDAGPSNAGWKDSDWTDGTLDSDGITAATASGEDNRLWGLWDSPVHATNDTSTFASNFWDITNNDENSNNSGWSLFLPRKTGNHHNYGVCAIFDPLTYDHHLRRISRFSAHSIHNGGGGKLTTRTGKRVHMDVWMYLHSNPYYLIGPLRQMRVGQDGFGQSTLMSSDGLTVKSYSAGRHLNSACDLLMFDND
jgi:hypothetical protein